MAMVPCRGFPLADIVVCLSQDQESLWELPVLSVLLFPYSFVPYIALSIAGLYFLVYRTSFSVLAGGFIGGAAVLNEGILKNIIKQPRPEGTCACGYGMPSGHAVITTGLLVWLSLELLLNNWNPKIVVHWSTKGKVFLLSLLVIFLLPTSYSRVLFRYHTWDQVATGSIVGGLLAITYYFFLVFFLAPHLDAIVKWRIISWLGIKNHYPPPRRTTSLVLPLYNNVRTI